MTLLGAQSPVNILDFGDKIAEKLVQDDITKREAYEKSGLISASKLGQPTLWAVLDMLGIEKEFDAYLLGKFKRGNDVEARAINFLTNIPVNTITDIIEGRVENPGWISLDDKSIIKGEAYLQMPCKYQEGVGYIDIAQRHKNKIILHEIKSSTKMAYDRVAATGRSATKKIVGEDGITSRETNTPQPYQHNAIQLSWYGLAENTEQCFLHYFNADDYRLTSFAIRPTEYKEEIDHEIDEINLAFSRHELPVFEPFLDYHKAYRNSTYSDWNGLNGGELVAKLKKEYFKKYIAFMTNKLNKGEK